MFRLLFRLIRIAFVAIVGTAIAAKFLLESNARPETEEIDLVAIFGGINLASTADPFYGGKVMVMLGGAQIDLRRATPAPTGIYLDVMILLGGLELTVPEGWRVKFNGQLIGAGFADETRTGPDDDAPTVEITGLVAAGGVRAGTRSRVGEDV